MYSVLACIALAFHGVFLAHVWRFYRAQARLHRLRMATWDLENAVLCETLWIQLPT